MDEVEKWMVDQARKQAPLAMQFPQQTIEKLATQWHEEGTAVLTMLQRGQSHARQTLGWQVSEIYAIVQRIERGAQQEQDVEVLMEPLKERIAELETDRDDWRRLANESVQEHIALKEQFRQEYPAPSWPLENQQTTFPIQNEPYLGLATNEQMLRELITRWRMEQYSSSVAVDRALALSEILGGLSVPEREYRTVDHD